MIRCTLAALLVFSAVAVSAEAEPPSKKEAPPPATPQSPRVIQLTVRAAARPQPRALAFPLLPDYLDRIPGNAAPFWLRAGSLARQKENEQKLDYQEYSRALESSLKDLPRKEIQKLLGNFRPALHLAEQAALRDHCDWEIPPVTLQNMDCLPLNEIQSLRFLTMLLRLRTRLEIAEGHLDSARHTIQVGLALAHDVGQGPTLIHSLVSVAITSIVLGSTEELLQQPDAPCLYWSLTDLPTPFVDLRPPLRYELATIYRSFPTLRELSKGPLSPAQAEGLGDSLYKAFSGLGQAAGVRTPGNKEDLTLLVKKALPDARRYLVDHGSTAAQLDAMPPMQIVLLHLLERYNDDRDSILKCFDLLPWQARPRLDALEDRLRAPRGNGSSVLEGQWIIQLLGPIILKSHHAGARLERQFAGLRCVEAIRLHAALHEGKPPRSLADITEVPLPLDPFTGKAFDAFYTATGDSAILEVPPPGMEKVLTLARRYEFRRSK